jgi:hypothetical protein
MREETEPRSKDQKEIDSDDDEDGAEQLQQPSVEKENKSVGSVNLKLYWTYFRASGGACSVICILAVNVVCQVLYSASDIWISYWTRAEEERLILAELVEEEAEFQEVHSLPSPLLQVLGSTYMVFQTRLKRNI